MICLLLTCICSVLLHLTYFTFIACFTLAVIVKRNVSFIVIFLYTSNPISFKEGGEISEVSPFYIKNFNDFVFLQLFLIDGTPGTCSSIKIIEIFILINTLNNIYSLYTYITYTVNTVLVHLCLQLKSA